jgi:hypothetical protein
MTQDIRDQDLTRASQRFRRDRDAYRQARVELSDAVRASLKGGRSIRAVAGMTGLSPVEVRRFRDEVIVRARDAASSRDRSRASASLGPADRLQSDADGD